MEIAEEMELEEQIPTPSHSNFEQFGLKNAIESNFREDYVFEIVARDDWTSIVVSLSTNAVKLYSPQTGQYLGDFFNDQSDFFRTCCIPAWDSRKLLA